MHDLWPRTFVDPRHQEEFAHQGWTVVELLPRAEALELGEELASIEGPGTGFVTSAQSSDHAYRDRVFELARNRVWPHLEPLLEGHRLLYASALTKHVGPDTTSPIHRDWTVVDRDRYRAVVVWIPLVEVTAAMGPLHVATGSHRSASHPRCHPVQPAEWAEQPPDSFAEMTPVEVPPGTGVAYDTDLQHGSPPNTGTATRFALGMCAVPERARQVHYFVGSSGVATRYRCPDAFLRRVQLGAAPELAGAWVDDDPTA